MSETNEYPGLENRLHHSMTSIREFLIIYGGYDNNTGEERNELWSYNTISDVWKRYPTPIGIKDTCLSSSICSVGNIVYLFGGDCFEEDDYRQGNSLVSFNLTNGSWEILYSNTDDYDDNTPPPMCGNLLFYHKQSLYVLGGFHGSVNIDKMYKFCLNTATWSIVAQNGVKPTFDSQIFGTVFKNK
ncbi:Tip elongation aberrant protein 1 [Thelohanellus kitauei]|uniref:Tip elongation aberrant protein 1 n=1 Tax=Thelohanellus kitauei TaxID=669202 RepID=A0A0C2NLE5_THEKT|nr:Tip elongation aberrant protein 1 [Thelohanellus kitauei]